MEVKMILVKRNGAERTEMSFEELSKEEQKMEGIRLKKHFFGILGYVEKSKPPA